MLENVENSIMRLKMGEKLENETGKNNASDGSVSMTEENDGSTPPRKKETGRIAIGNARERHKVALNGVYVALAKINMRLVELQKLIEDSQHKKHGSITLSLSDCGRKCLGCPHATWLKWIDKTKTQTRIAKAGGFKNTDPKKLFFAVKTKEPLRIIAQSRAVKDHTAAMFVAEAKALVDSRAKIIERLSMVVRETSKYQD